MPNLFEDPKSARDEIEGRIETLTRQIRRKRDEAEKLREKAASEDADADRMRRIRSEYLALPFTLPLPRLGPWSRDLGPDGLTDSERDECQQRYDRHPGSKEV